MSNPSPRQHPMRRCIPAPAMPTGLFSRPPNLTLRPRCLLHRTAAATLQEISSVRIGAKGFDRRYTAGGSLWIMQNAYTLDGTSWYPFDESAPSFGIKTGGGGAITFNYSPALNADGPITWTVIDQWGAAGRSTTLTRLTTDAGASLTPSLPFATVRDLATLTTNRNLVLHTAQDGWRVVVARNGAAGGFSRQVKQDDGSTLIKNVADGFTGTFVYDGTAAAWYLESYAACT
jgi:hypothetical protein